MQIEAENERAKLNVWFLQRLGADWSRPETRWQDVVANR